MLVIINRISFSYDGKTQSIDSLSTSIDEGEVLGLAGHNGAGKTTLLKLVSGLLECQQGQIRYSFPNQESNHISYVPDQGGFYEELSGISNLIFRGEMANIPDCKDRAANLLNSIGLYEKRNEKARAYSHGMRKRLAIACACMQKPSLLLLDESLNGIDPESRDEIIELLNKMKKEGVGIVLSTHDLELIEDLCDKIAILQEGALLFKGGIPDDGGGIRQLYREKVIKDR